MGAVRDRVPSAASPRSPTEREPGERESKLSRYFLWWLPVAPLVGFVVAGRVLDLGAEGQWEPWKAALLGVLLMAPFAVGAAFGLRSVLKGCRGGWVGLTANVVLGALAIGMPVAESLTG